MNYIRIPLLGLLFIAFALAGCREEIDVSLATGEPRLIVDGWIHNRKGPVSVKLSLTSDYYTKATTALKDIEVTLSDGTREYGFVRVEESRFVTADTLDPQTGQTFTLNIRYKGERYQAIATMPEIFPIDKIEWEYQEQSSLVEEGYYVRLGIQETAGQRNFARWVLYEDGERLGGPDNIAVAEDEWVNGSYFDFIVGGPFDEGTQVVVEQWGIEEGAHDYLQALQNLSFNAGSPFAATPVNPPTNVRNLDNRENNAVGYFGAASVDTRSIIVGE